MPSGGGTANDPSHPLTHEVSSAEVENQVGTIDAPMSAVEKFAVPIVFTIFVVFRAADRVFMKVVNNDLLTSNYNLMFSNIIWPAAMQVITCCIIVGYVIMQRMQGHVQYNLSFFKLNNPMASSTGAIPTYMLALFSLGDQLNAALSAPASAFVSQPIQSVMTNFILIWMAIVGFFWIKVRFKACHYGGMALVIGASLVQFAPFALNNDCSPEGLEKPTVLCFSAYHTTIGGDDGSWVKLGGGAMAFFYILFVVSTFPAAVSNIYKQKVLQGVDADIFYVTLWSGWFQWLWGWICIPVMWIHLPNQPVLTPGQTLVAFTNTTKCLAGDGDIGPSCDQAPPPYVYVLLYFAFNATFNLCITWLIKRISATWVQVATVLCLNLCNIFSSLKFIMGSSAQPMSAYDWAAAVIVSFALVVYNLQPEVTADGTKVLTQVSGSFVADGHAQNVEKLSGTTPSGSFVKPGSFVG